MNIYIYILIVWRQKECIIFLITLVTSILISVRVRSDVCPLVRILPPLSCHSAKHASNVPWQCPLPLLPTGGCYQYVILPSMLAVSLGGVPCRFCPQEDVISMSFCQACWQCPLAGSLAASAHGRVFSVWSLWLEWTVNVECSILYSREVRAGDHL